MARTILTEELAAHLRDDPSIYIASASAEREPALTRAVLARPLDARDAIDVFVAASASEGLVRTVTPGRRAAIVAARVHDYRTYQYKGAVESVSPATADEVAIVEDAIARFGTVVAQVGIDAARYCATLSTPPYVRIRIEVDGVFDQTPRIGAGAQVRGAGRDGGGRS